MNGILQSNEQINAGSRVEGVYGPTGQAFRGVVRESRASVTFDCMEFLVNLDSPLDCFGQKRSTICIHANPADGCYRNVQNEAEWIKRLA